MVAAEWLIEAPEPRSGVLQVEAFAGGVDEAARRWGAGNGGTALVSAPAAFRVLSAEEFAETIATGVGDIFEVRLFDDERELRWVRAGATGTGCLLSEAPADASARSVGYSATNDVRYLLWGRGTGAEQTAEQRIGSLRLPVRASVGQRCALRVREYIVRDANGNACVAEERLQCLEVIE